MNVLCFSVTPSPYQRDLFRALHARAGVDLEVRYFESAADDSQRRACWNGGRAVMPGKVLGRGRVHCHWNRGLPDPAGFDAVIVNGPLTGATTQRLFRMLKRPGPPDWFFWGELLLPRSGG